ncbi:glycosyltransferase family 52 [Ornithobacterium rhinotracheale]|uniref:Glycosyltransferase family 52 n=2 Tax=Ornithobacterium rhinotracheale TaxID=28251 RepID=I3ZZD7_ORNRL|nr:glycosyltransferase family 52 [Ornithobacterium rhinotracheale]AFL97071.1 Glycosyltransferase family 52 [Ornithobacterium rhinotracheale DSM 15997]AIQ00448.1 hypothetical protein Q785_04950 [Ornithobacterium rhinotracheale ORT-UMN 88]KGB67409.1 hypothetical protein Q787_04825 [Ornithobacterium rhinotracheale H06-030791]MCK0194410.1 glycosyltransferase family 52 protein [Ornithobacterium rhinotracheale]MCK0199936.1 glycosyltransferase family 52 protein [Ornithobacterium rhinotracheale]
MKFKNTLIFSTIYPLLLFLLSIKDEDIDKTFYFISNLIPKELSDKLPHKYIYKAKTKPIIKTNTKLDGYTILLQNAFYYRYLILLQKIKWHFLKTADIYSHDHSIYTYTLINGRSFIKIEDGLEDHDEPVLKEQKKNSVIYNIKRFIWNYLLTTKYLKEKSENRAKHYIITISSNKFKKNLDLTHAWEKASPYKKEYILNLFNLTSKEIEILKQKKNIIFTQPFFEDGYLQTEKEKIEIYKNFIKTLNHKDIILKTHPREKTNYKEHLPHIEIFEKAIPSELFDLCGISFNNVYSVSSTAAFHFPITSNIKQIETGKNLIGEKLFKDLLEKRNETKYYHSSI